MASTHRRPVSSSGSATSVNTTVHKKVARGAQASGDALGAAGRRSGDAAVRRRGGRPSTAARREALAEGLRAAVDRFERHLTLERGLSAHSVRAYVGDVVSLTIAEETAPSATS